MPLSIDHATKLITIPLSELTLVSGTRYKITVEYYWELLREANYDEEGMILDTMYNSTASTSSTPQIVDIINGFTVQFEDGLYSVELINGNTNFREVEVKNTVSVGTNNTTGFIDPVFLESGLFAEGVVLDVINGVAGTTKTGSGGIIGTRQTPSNNISDARIIADFRGVKTFKIVNSMTGPTALINEDLSSAYTFEGDSPFNLLTIDPSANVTNCALRNLTVEGELDGLNTVRDCSLKDITNASGFFEKCAFQGNVSLAGDTSIFECYSQIPGGGHPTFSVSDHVLIVRNFHGSIGVGGAVTNHISSLGVFGGQVTIDNTCIGGNIHIRGEPFLITDNSGIGCTTMCEIEGAKARAVHEANYNKRIHDKTANTITIYDEDKVTPKQVFDANDELTEISPQ